MRFKIGMFRRYGDNTESTLIMDMGVEYETLADVKAALSECNSSIGVENGDGTLTIEAGDAFCKIQLPNGDWLEPAENKLRGIEEDDYYGLVSVEYAVDLSTKSPCTICEYKHKCRAHPSFYIPCCEQCKHGPDYYSCWKQFMGGGCNKAFIKLSK